VQVTDSSAGFTYDGVIHKMSDKQWDTMLAVHGSGPFRLVRAAAPYLRKKDGANKCIINISSTSGLHGNAGQINYAFAKAGVEGFTKTIAKEWGMFGVRSCTVAFGYIETRLTADKGDGAVMMVDGKPVALGIPGRGKGPTSVSAVADIPLGRAGQAHEAAASILLMACPLASYINGITLPVTGGRGI
jgi:3-oxoacyl-[acyl-carrier protein] reductase